jgi:uncharacterized protein
MKKTDRITETLIALNPWWSDNFPDTGVIREQYLTRMNRYIRTGEILVLNGVRRSGKTTLLLQLLVQILKTEGIDPKKMLFISFDEPLFSTLSDPIDEILTHYHSDICPDKDGYLFFDEIQQITGWERWIKALYDRKRYHIVISGSSSYLLERKAASLFSGRYLQISVFPLTFREFLTFSLVTPPKDLVEEVQMKYHLMEQIRRYLITGGFPRIVLEQDEQLRRELLKAYYDSIVSRDIVLNQPVRQVRVMYDLIYVLLSSLSSPFSYRKLATQFSVDVSTIREYTGFITSSHLLSELKIFSYSVSVQNTNPKKIYCIDNGIRNAVSFTFSSDVGKLIENTVWIHLYAQGMQAYYWKDQGEVDFVIKHPDNTITGINVSYTDDLPEREVRALREFKDTFGEVVRNRVMITKDTEGEEDGIRYIPLWRWLIREDLGPDD